MSEIIVLSDDEDNDDNDVVVISDSDEETPDEVNKTIEKYEDKTISVSAPPDMIGVGTGERPFKRRKFVKESTPLEYTSKLIGLSGYYEFNRYRMQQQLEAGERYEMYGCKRKKTPKDRQFLFAIPTEYWEQIVNGGREWVELKYEEDTHDRKKWGIISHLNYVQLFMDVWYDLAQWFKYDADKVKDEDELSRVVLKYFMCGKGYEHVQRMFQARNRLVEYGKECPNRVIQWHEHFKEFKQKHPIFGRDEGSLYWWIKNVYMYEKNNNIFGRSRKSFLCFLMFNAISFTSCNEKTITTDAYISQETAEQLISI